eukprot:TRINITY_DN9039_c1_g1_i1.p1 TRINITY_DN9039_c1_g1~~TRINITY_DN9039_c1_g1_i1.p1  ORF type:complete len:316 (+),score=66.91 TRINITY_DN9039_c1_g1_i1:78-1025(+)
MYGPPTTSHSKFPNQHALFPSTTLCLNHRKKEMETPPLQLLASQMKMWCDYNYGAGWHVVVGRSIELGIRYDQKKFIVMQQKPEKASGKLAPLTVIAFKAAPSYGAQPFLEGADDEAKLKGPRLSLKVESCNMAADMETTVLGCLEKAWKLKNEQTSAVELFKYNLVQNFGNTWHVVAAKLPHLCASVNEEAECMISVICETTHFVAFKHNGKAAGRFNFLPKWEDVTAKHVAVLFYFAALSAMLVTYLYPVSECGDHELCKRVIENMPMTSILMLIIGFLLRFVFKVQDKRVSSLQDVVDEDAYLQAKQDKKTK